MSEHLGANLAALQPLPLDFRVCRQLAINRAQFSKYLRRPEPADALQPQADRRLLRRRGLRAGLAARFARLIGARASAQPRQSSNDPLLRLLQPRCAPRPATWAATAATTSNMPACRCQAASCSPWCISTRRTACSSSSARNARSAPAVPTQAEDGRVAVISARPSSCRTGCSPIDYESLTLNEMSQTILIPSFKSRITRLNGLKMGVSSGDRRTRHAAGWSGSTSVRKSTGSTPTARCACGTIRGSTRIFASAWRRELAAWVAGDR